ncbi:MAG: hypothetical protein JNN07_02035 [Verrucomicrobiales bacterium]|nr:hypothetical protein [Verrucomicrobiales bacterium]
MMISVCWMATQPGRRRGLRTGPGARVLAAVLWAVTSASCLWADSVWNKAGSGTWMEAASWLGGLPSSTQAVSVVNAGSKVVTIDSTAPAGNRVIRRLNLAGTAGSTNTLRLSGMGAVPLLSSNTVSLGVGGRLEILSSRFVIDGSAQGSLTLLSGDLLLDGGELSCIAGARARIGREGLGSMTLRAGMFRSASDLVLGGLAGSVGRLSMGGGTSIVSGILILGDDPLSRGEFQLNGGSLIATNGTARIGEDGSGSFILSDGLALMEDVSVGRSSNSAGVLLLTGGILRCNDLSVGRFSSSTGQFVLRGGTFQASADSLYVGREGVGEMLLESGQARVLELQLTAASTARGRLSLSGGTLTVGSNLTVGVVAGRGAEAVISRGALNVTNLEQTALLQVGSGGLQLSGGSVLVDRLLLASAQGTFVFNGGELSTRQSEVSNGKAFVVGDGVQIANLHLQGGVHRFPNGLVINSRATLTGCGTIVGNVTVLAGGASLLRCGGPELAQFRRTPQGVGFSFVGTAGVTYTVEYTDELVPALWKTLRTVVGNGGASSVEDSFAPLGNRFYRLISPQP